MGAPFLNINEVPQAIQLALGPVFLLTGIAGVLNVMAGRLARIIDRGRQLTEDARVPPALHAFVEIELKELNRRRLLASAAITACTLSALLVCVVIATLFIEELLDAPLKWLVGVLFTGATFALVIGLAYFLREVHLATTTVRIPETLRSREPAGPADTMPSDAG
jgi:MFS family permease